MRLALVIGLRAVRGRAVRRRFALIGVVGAVAWLALATCLAAVTVKEAEAARARAGEPVLAAPPAAGLPYAALTHEYRGRDVLVVAVADADPGAAVRLPPGVERLPGDGEVLVSPALRDRMEADGTLRAWFEGRRVTALPPAAVGSAGELRAYLRLPPGEVASAERVVSYGAQRPSGPAPARPYELIGLGLFVAVPAFVLLVTASRFGKGVRVRRHRALRLLGMSNAAASAAAAVELAVPAAVGAAVAAVAAGWAVDGVVRVPVVDRYAFDGDLGMSPVAAAVLVVVVAAATGAMGAATAADGTLLKRAGATFHRLRGPAHVLALVYVAGIAGVAFAWVRHRPRDPVLWVAVVVLGAAMPGAIAWLAAFVARRAARPTSRVGWLIGLRRIAADPRNATRAAGAIGVAVFVVGAAQPISQVVAQPQVAWAAQARETGATTVMGRAETLRPVAFVPRTPPPPGVTGLAPALGVWSSGEAAEARPGTAALQATCAQLRDLTGQSLPSCVEGRPYVLVREGAVPPKGSLLLRSADRARSGGVAVPSESLRIEPTDMPLDATLLLPPGHPAVAAVGEPFAIGAYLRVSADEDAWEAARAWVLAASPAHRLENVYEASALLDTTPRWILLGLACVAAFAAAASVLTALDDRTRRGQWFRLRALGMSRLRVASTQVAEALVTSGASIAVATLGSVGVTSAYLRVNGDHLRDVRPFVTAAGFALLSIVVVTVVTAALAQTDDVGNVEA